MSSDFYPSSLSRNLVRTGGAGYRENASLRLLLEAAAQIAGRPDRDRSASAGFTAFPDFGIQADMTRKSILAGRIRLSKPPLSFAQPRSAEPPPSP